MSIAASTPALVCGAAGEHRIPLRDGRLTIGRAFGSDIRLEHIHVSRNHAALEVRRWSRCDSSRPAADARRLAGQCRRRSIATPSGTWLTQGSTQRQKGCPAGSR